LPFGDAPIGTIAPFWQDMTGNPGNSKVLWQQFDPDSIPGSGDEYTLISWENWGRWDMHASFNFQVKFFESTGDLEFQYGSMTADDPTAFDGSSSTIWIEDPTGFEASVISANTAGTLHPNSAFHFTAL
jgi:hypothetical protein